MVSDETIKWVTVGNRVLLGAVMLVPGLLKLFVLKPATIQGMLSGLGFPIAGVLAWVLIIAEILTGIAILAKFKLEWATIPPVVILVVAAFTFHMTPQANWPNVIVHLALASNFVLLGLGVTKE